MATMNTAPFRADHVGSLTRSSRLLEARRKHSEGSLALADLRAIEDEEISRIVAVQERVGLHSITDGELRRGSWRDDFFENVDGFTKQRFRSPLTFTDTSGAKQESRPIPHIERRITRRRNMVVDYFKFLKLATRGTPKATLPSPRSTISIWEIAPIQHLYTPTGKPICGT